MYNVVLLIQGQHGLADLWNFFILQNWNFSLTEQQLLISISQPPPALKPTTLPSGSVTLNALDITYDWQHIKKRETLLC